MTDENGSLRHEFNQYKTENEANMRILEANFEKSLSANREAIAKLLAAFERHRSDTKTAYESLRADMSKMVILASTILGAFMAFAVLVATIFG